MTEDSPKMAELSKFARALLKKLRQVDELEKLDFTKLNAAQRTKIARKGDLLAQLKSEGVSDALMRELNEQKQADTAKSGGTKRKRVAEEGAPGLRHGRAARCAGEHRRFACAISRCQVRSGRSASSVSSRVLRPG